MLKGVFLKDQGRLSAPNTRAAQKAVAGAGNWADSNQQHRSACCFEYRCWADPETSRAWLWVVEAGPAPHGSRLCEVFGLDRRKYRVLSARNWTPLFWNNQIAFFKVFLVSLSACRLDFTHSSPAHLNTRCFNYVCRG